MKFSFVNKILEMVPGKSILAEKKIGSSEEYFKDHFPGFPVVPGVLLTEMMAQTAGKCLDAERRPRGKAMLAQIRSAKFRKWVEPGQTALIYANITANQESYATANCRVEVNNQTVCKAELFFSFVLMKDFSPDYRDDVLESFLSLLL